MTTDKPDLEAIGSVTAGANSCTTNSPSAPTASFTDCETWPFQRVRHDSFNTCDMTHTAQIALLLPQFRSMCATWLVYKNMTWVTYATHPQFSSNYYTLTSPQHFPVDFQETESKIGGSTRQNLHTQDWISHIPCPGAFAADSQEPQNLDCNICGGYEQ